MVQTQMTKGGLLACGRSRDDVADFYLVVVDDDAINQQLYQLSTLGEVELLKGGLQPSAEVFNAAGQPGHVQLLLGLRLQLTQVLRQATLRLSHFSPFALELVAADHLSHIDLKQSGLLALQLSQGCPQGALTIL